MNYFKPKEFQGYWSNLSPDLLVKLNKLRASWGKPIHVSPVNGAVGRRDNSGSYHNINRWGKVRAVDIFPIIDNPDDAVIFYGLARKAGFQGVGVYPKYTYGGVKSTMFHVDTRRESVLWVDTGNYPNHDYKYISGSQLRSVLTS